MGTVIGLLTKESYHTLYQCNPEWIWTRGDECLLYDIQMDESCPDECPRTGNVTVVLQWNITPGRIQLFVCLLSLHVPTIRYNYQCNHIDGSDFKYQHRIITIIVIEWYTKGIGRNEIGFDHIESYWSSFEHTTYPYPLRDLTHRQSRIWWRRWWWEWQW